MKQFISVNDAPDIDRLVKQALEYKSDPLKDKTLGTGKRVGLLFFNPSLRTRLSTQIAAQQLGMEAIVFNAGGDGWGLEFEDGAVMNGTSVEHIKDAAPVLGTYFDILCIRTFPSLKDREADYSEKVLQQFIRHSRIPVISLESATLHPLQSLADAITIHEFLPKPDRRKPKVVLTWAPHIKPIPQCVGNSFAEWMSAWEDVDLTIAHPEGFELNPIYTKNATTCTNQAEALAGADFVYVKNWSSYKDYGAVCPDAGSWMLTEEKLGAVAPSARIMHCLPVRRNVELCDTLLDGPRSLVTQQAGNRVWSAQVVLSEILKNNL